MPVVHGPGVVERGVPGGRSRQPRPCRRRAGEPAV